MDADVVAVDLDVGRPGRRDRGDAGDPVGLLVPELARATDRGGPARSAPRPGAEDGDAVESPPRHRPAQGRSRKDFRGAHGRGRRRARRSGDAVLGVIRPGASSMSAPILRRLSMMARRVGLTPTLRMVSSASGWIEPATSQNVRTRSSSASEVAKNSPPSSRTTATPGPLVVGVLGQLAEDLGARLARQHRHVGLGGDGDQPQQRQADPDDDARPARRRRACRRSRRPRPRSRTAGRGRSAASPAGPSCPSRRPR